MDGRVTNLRIAPLSLSDTVISPRATIPPIPVDQVAFVAIHRVGKPGRGPPGFEAYRVHVAGGKHFLVHAESIGKGEAQGFLAQPLPEEDSPYERFIFYYRGVTRVEVNQPDTKIWTAEDPVEITQAGLRQVQIQTKIGLDFAAALRSFLRADPDVIMVGEMRDKEAAGMAVEASLTGHLVLSTLHTNSAPETIVRLLDMGLDPFSFADALVCVLAQRLARRVCVACREEREGTQDELDALNRTLVDAGGRPLEVRVGVGFRLWRGKGCAVCGDSGYKGRVALHEVLLIDEGIKVMIHKRASAELLRDAAMHAGMRTLLEDGVAKTLAGETDLRQVIAVCSR